MRVSVRITSDNIFVLSHDESINTEARTVDGIPIAEKVVVADIVSKYGYMSEIWYSTVFKDNLNMLSELVPFSNLALIQQFEAMDLDYLVAIIMF